MNYILKTNVIYLITITIVGVSLRYHFWPEASYGDREFYAILNENFFEYIFFTSLNPPLNYIIPGIFVKIFGLERILPILLQFVVFLDLVGLILIFISLQSIKLNKNIVFYFVFYLSVFYIPFEFWRNGTHYDHWTFFLNCLFIYFIVKLVKKTEYFFGDFS